MGYETRYDEDGKAETVYVKEEPDDDYGDNEDDDGVYDDRWRTQN